MLKILYWNIQQKGNDLIDVIAKLSKGIDILIISELAKSKPDGKAINEIIDGISKNTGLEYVGTKSDTWIYLWMNPKIDLQIELVAIYDKLTKPSDLADIRISRDSEYFAHYLNKFERMLFFKISFKGLNFLLTPIHFPSKLYASSDKQKDISQHFKKYIEIIENKYNLKSLVVGDFNMNPFETGMIHHDGFHALPSQELTKKSIKFYSTPYKTFYNPTWEKFGDFYITDGSIKRKPSGSYYLKDSQDINYYWYIFDQVILRNELIPHFCFEHFKYITSIDSENDMLNKDLSPNQKLYSDHLPITFALKN